MDKEERDRPKLQDVLRGVPGKSPRFTLWGAVAAVLYWLLESCLHAFVFSPSYSLVQTLLVEHDPNELVMRLMIAALLVTLGSAADAHQRQQRKLLAHIQDINRLLVFLSDINQLKSRRLDTRALLDAACHIATAQGGFHAAWVGLLHAETGALEPRAYYDMHDTMADARSVALDAPCQGCDIASRAIRGRQAFICNNLAHSPCTGFCHAELERHGAAAAAAFPLFRDDEVLGAFTVYARNTGFFEGDVVAVLTEAAGDISVALEAIEHERRLQERLEELERFRQATMQREFRIKELRDENAALKKELAHLRRATDNAR